MNYNAKQNKKDAYGNTPLIYACLNGHYETTALLLQVRSLKTVFRILLLCVTGACLGLRLVLLFKLLSVKITQKKRAFFPLPPFTVFDEISVTLQLYS